MYISNEELINALAEGTRSILKKTDETHLPLKALLTDLLKDNSLLLLHYRSAQADLIKKYQLVLKSLLHSGVIKLENQLVVNVYAVTRAQQLADERFEAERLEAERLVAERLEAERLEAERLEAERLEAERLEAERLEAERLEAERLEAERLEAERLEAERQRAYLARNPESIEHQRLKLNDALKQILVKRQNQLEVLTLDQLEARYQSWRRGLADTNLLSTESVFELHRCKMIGESHREFLFEHPISLKDCEIIGELKILLKLSLVEGEESNILSQIDLKRIQGDRLTISLDSAHRTNFCLESLYFDYFELISERGCMPTVFTGSDLQIEHASLHSAVKKDGHKNAWRLDLFLHEYGQAEVGPIFKNHISSLSLDCVYVNRCELNASRIDNLSLSKINTLFSDSNRTPLGNRIAALTELGESVNAHFSFKETTVGDLEISKSNLNSLSFERSVVERAKLTKFILFKWLLNKSYFAFRGEGKQSARYLNVLKLESSAFVNSAKAKKSIKLELEYLPFKTIEGIYERPNLSHEIIIQRSFLGYIELQLPSQLKRLELSDCCALQSLSLTPGHRTEHIAVEELCVNRFTSLQTTKHFNQLKLSSLSAIETEAFDVELREDDGSIKDLITPERFITWIEEMTPNQAPLMVLEDQEVDDPDGSEDEERELSELEVREGIDEGDEVEEAEEEESMEEGSLNHVEYTDPLTAHLSALKIYQLYNQNKGSLRLENVDLGTLHLFKIKVPFTLLKQARLIPHGEASHEHRLEVEGLRIRTIDSYLPRLTASFYDFDAALSNLDKNNKDKLMSRSFEGLDQSNLSDLLIRVQSNTELSQQFTFNRAQLDHFAISYPQVELTERDQVNLSPQVCLSFNRSRIEELSLTGGAYQQLRITHSELLGETRLSKLNVEELNFKGSNAQKLILQEINRNALETVKSEPQQLMRGEANQSVLGLDEVKAEEVQLSVSHFHRVDLRRARLNTIKMSRMQLAMLRMWRAPSRLIKLLRYLPEQNVYQELQITQTQLAGIESRPFEEKYLPVPKGTLPYELNALTRDGEPRSDLFVLMGELEHKRYLQMLDDQLNHNDIESESSNHDPEDEDTESTGSLREIVYPIILFNDDDLSSSQGQRAKIYHDQKLADSLIERVKQEYQPTEIQEWEIDRSSINNESFTEEEERLDLAHYSELKTRLSSKLSRLLSRPSIKRFKVKESSFVRNRCFSWLEYQRLEVSHSALCDEVFAEAIIHKDAHFERSDIDGLRTFAGAHIKGETELHLCTFLSDAQESFKESELMGNLSLNMITIQRQLSLQSAVLHESLNLTDFTIEPRPDKSTIQVVNNVTIDLRETRFERALSIATPHLNEPKDAVSLTVNLEKSIITRVLDLSRLGKTMLNVSLFDEFGQVEEEVSVPFEPLVIFDKLSYNELLVHPLGLGEMTYQLEPYRSIPAPVSAVKALKKTRGFNHWYRNRVSRGQLSTQDHLRNARFYKHLYSAAQNKGRHREWRYYHRRFIKHLNRAHASLHTLERPLSRTRGALLSFLQWYELDIYSVIGRFSIAKLAVKAMGLSVLMLGVHLFALGQTEVTKELLFISTVQSWFGPVFGLLGISLHDMEEVHGFATQMIYGVHCIFNLFLLAPILQHGFSISAPESIELQIERSCESEVGELERGFTPSQLSSQGSLGEYLVSISVLTLLLCTTYSLSVCAVGVGAMITMMVGTKFYAREQSNDLFSSLSLGLLFGLLSGLSFFGAATHLIALCTERFGAIFHLGFFGATTLAAVLTTYAIYALSVIFTAPSAD